MSTEIRIGQLIVPFGPGSLYTDQNGMTQVICGLDHWYRNQGDGDRAKDPGEFFIHDPRLCQLLGVETLRRPPDWREGQASGQQSPPNACLGIPVHRFPTWHRDSATGNLRQFNLDREGRLDPPASGGQWRPVRFVAVCANGHLDDFPWKSWAGCTCNNDEGLYLRDGGGGSLASVVVGCRSCGRSRDLSGVTYLPGEGDGSQGDEGVLAGAGIRCAGGRPWLGEAGREDGCGAPVVGALINQTNLWFGNTVTSILLPVRELADSLAEMVRILHKNPGIYELAKLLWDDGQKENAANMVRLQLQESVGVVCDLEQAMEVLRVVLCEKNLKPVEKPVEPESPEAAYRRTEFDILREELLDHENSPDLRIVATRVPDGLENWLDRVMLVERLKATTAFCGFSRLEKQPLRNMPDLAMNQLFLNPPCPNSRWLPAVEVFGEGIYLEVREDAIARWLGCEREWLEKRLGNQYLNRMHDAIGEPRPDVVSRDWAARYLMLHSLAHVLINQLVFESGYSTASLRERLYVSADPAAPMAGILIYTAAGDSEGTLGGLVRSGHPERFSGIFRNALSRASWCSADPVCSENLGGQGARGANLAACHACILLPETSCETINEGLDRAMLVGEPEYRKGGFLSELLEGMLELG